MFKRNKKKKIVIIVLSVILTLSVICLLYWRMDMQQRRKIYDDMKMEFNIPETIEYGSEIQAKDLIQSHEGGTLTKLPELDTKKKGEQKLLFRMTKNGIEREFSCTVTVKDTQPPEIVLTILCTKNHYFSSGSFTSSANSLYCCSLIPNSFSIFFCFPVKLYLK